MLHDLRLALRSLLRAPAFSLATLLTLTVGLGITYAVFSVVHAVLLRPLPYADPQRLAAVLHEGSFPVGPANYLDYRRDARAMEAVGVAQAWGVTVSGAGETERLTGLGVSANLFDLLGVGAAAGRTFAPGEDEPGRNRVVVISHGLWQRRFGGDRGALDRTITLDGEPHTVVGVMPAGFHFAPFWITNAEIWRPLDLSSRVNDRGGQSLRVFARLRHGTSLESAQAEATGIARRLARDFPDDNTGLGLTVVPLHEKAVGPIRSTLAALAVMAVLVLLVACGNAAGLQVVRSAGRRREVAVRAALGARPARLAREMIAESVVLGVAAGAMALVVAAWALDLLRALLPAGSLPRQAELSIDLPFVVVACVVAVISGALAGLAPALVVWRSRWAEALRDGGRSATEGAGAQRARRLLLGAQLAMATALLAGAALMGRTLVQLAAVDPGFEPAGVLSLTVSLAGTRHDDNPASRVAAVDAIEQALVQQPGVTSVGAINHLPLAGDAWRLRLLVEGRPVPPRGEEPRAVWRVVKPGYFDAMDIGRVRGRLLGPADRDGAVPVALVNRALARAHWPGGDPLGARIRIGTDVDAPPLTVVGVVEDVRQEAWTGAVGEEVYVPYAQHARAFGADTLTWVMRTSADPAALAGPARRAVWSVDRGLPVSRLATLETVIADHLWRARVTALLLGLFAGSALTLAGLGVYGVSTYAMRRRTREIGIRIALGARPGHVSSLVAREMAAPVAGGVLAGCLLALALSRVLASLLYGVEPRDPATYVATALVLAALSTAAAWVPARRASRVDPLRAIREE